MSDRMGEEIARNAETLAAVQAAYERYAETLVAEWWCALCPTSHPTRAALDKHTAAGHPTSMIGTSARLRQLQQERDEACALSVELLRDNEGMAATLAMRTGQLNASRRFVAEARREGDLLKAELASARTELAQLRAQLAAHPDGGDQP